MAFYLAGEMTQVLDAIPWVHCAFWCLGKANAIVNLLSKIWHQEEMLANVFLYSQHLLFLEIPLKHFFAPLKQHLLVPEKPPF